MGSRFLRHFSKKGLIIFALIFAGIGSYLLIKSFAAAPNTSGANIFVSASGSNSGSNCVRFSTPQTSPPSASTVCATVAKAYSLAQLGDTVWVLPGNYSGSTLGFSSSNTAASKTLGSNECNLTEQCVYVTAQPGQTVNLTSNLSFSQNDTPDHIYYSNFEGAEACPVWNADGFGASTATNTGYGKDITVDNVKATDCKPFISGAWSYLRILNSEFSYNCDTEGDAGGFGVQSNQPGLGGESDDHTWAPSHITIDKTYFHDFVINGCAGGHQDCIHIYAWTESRISNSKFNRCYDSSILAEGLDEDGYQENVVLENNWFGPTILGVNNCCFRGDSVPSAETFDSWIIRFNTSVDTFMNKSGNVLNNVSFIGNIGLGNITCKTGTNVVYAYNMMGSGACGATDIGGISNSQVKLVNTAAGSLDLHLQTGSTAINRVPVSQANGCSAVSGGKDFEADNRDTATGGSCDAGADEFASSGSSGPVANLWVDTNGGTCTRQSTAGAYNDAAACGSFAAAYAAATSGDKVFVKAGSYATQTISTNNGSLTSAVTIQAATGEAVSLNRLEVRVNWVTFVNMTVNAPFNTTGQGIFTNGAQHVIFDNVDVTGAEANFNPVGGDDVQYLNADFGTPGNTQIRKCAAHNPEPVQIDGTDNLVMRNVKFWPFQPELGNPACGPDNNMHLETIRVNFNSANFKLDRLWMLEGDGSGTARIFTSGDGSSGQITNSYFADGATSIHMCAGTGGDANIVIAYNTIKSSINDEGCTNSIRYIGNTSTQPAYLPCPGINSTGVKNLWAWNSAKTGCGSDSWLVDASYPGFGDFNFDGVYKLTADGIHLASNSPAINAGEKTLCTQYTGGVDIDGDPRSDATCDAGADELSGGTPPPADTTPPTVSLSAPANGATVSGTTSVSATASDNVGVVGVQFKLDGANLASEDTSSPYSVSWDTTTATNASHTLTAVARDAAGNTTTASSRTVTVNNPTPDTTPPTVSMTAPAAGATISGSAVTVSATASDNVGVAGVQFKLDGANLASEDTSSPYSISWNSTSVANGNHTLTAVARDAAGNTTTATSRTVNVNNTTPDTTPPSVPASLIVSTNPNLVTTATTITLSWGASTDSGGSGLAGYKIFRGATLVQTVNSSTTTYTDPYLTPGTTYTYTVVAYDNNNNNSAASSARTATTGTLIGDLDGDNHVFGHDLSILLANFNTHYVRAEFDGFPLVQAHNLSLLLSNYGK